MLLTILYVSRSKLCDNAIRLSCFQVVLSICGPPSRYVLVEKKQQEQPSTSQLAWYSLTAFKSLFIFWFHLIDCITKNMLLIQMSFLHVQWMSNFPLIFLLRSPLLFYFLFYEMNHRCNHCTWIIYIFKCVICETNSTISHYQIYSHSESAYIQSFIVLHKFLKIHGELTWSSTINGD